MTVKTAIITGAASGIGKHWARVLSTHRDLGTSDSRDSSGSRYSLVLADIDEPGLHAAFTPTEQVRLHILDIRSCEQWQRVVESALTDFGRIDYLFNIAGVGRPAFLVNQPIENIDLLIDVNLKGTLLGMKLVGDVMLKQGSGHIVNVASLAALSPTPGNALYSAAKGGLRNASLAAAIEWRQRGVYVTVVSPDLVDTPIMQRHLATGRDEVALTYTGVTLTVTDLEKAFFKAMRDKPLEINLPRWRGWLTKLNHVCPSLMFILYEPMKRRGMKRLEQIRQQRLGQKD